MSMASAGIALLLQGSMAVIDPLALVPAPVIPPPHLLYAAHILNDTELARLRGGVRLPNGLDLTLGIDIATRVDGQLALHTLYTSDGPSAGTRIVPDDQAPSSTGSPAGTVTLTTGATGIVATLDRPDLQIRHMIGEATGVVVANTGNDRVIDTVSSVNVDLRGSSPLLASSLFINQAVVLDAIRPR